MTTITKQIEALPYFLTRRITQREDGHLYCNLRVFVREVLRGASHRKARNAIYKELRKEGSDWFDVTYGAARALEAYPMTFATQRRLYEAILEWIERWRLWTFNPM